MSTGQKILFGIPLSILFLAWVKVINALDAQLMLMLFFGFVILAAWIPPQAAKARRATTTRAQHVYHNNPVAKAHRRWNKYWRNRGKKRRAFEKRLERQEIERIVSSAIKKNQDQVLKEILDRYIRD